MATVLPTLNEHIRKLARREIRAKYMDRDGLRPKLQALQNNWSSTRNRLAQHLPSFAEARHLLAEAGCPVDPEQIGITRERLRRSYRQAYFIRRRFTVLDFTAMWGLTESMLDQLFADSGCWCDATARAESRRA